MWLFVIQNLQDYFLFLIWKMMSFFYLNIATLPEDYNMDINTNILCVKLGWLVTGFFITNYIIKCLLLEWFG